tara:strand:+ start:46 stop:438 length:393 start_codon:yes stop_codon:yes gene_type:complete
MMEDEFYATLKLKTGEEIFCKVCASEEEDRTLLLVSHPITVQEIKNKVGIIGYKVEPWLKTTDEDLFILNLNDILTMSESSDMEMIHMYQSFIKDTTLEKNSKQRMNRKMGYLGNVSDTKETLEKIFKEN